MYFDDTPLGRAAVVLHALHDTVTNPLEDPEVQAELVDEALKLYRVVLLEAFPEQYPSDARWALAPEGARWTLFTPLRDQVRAEVLRTLPGWGGVS